MSEPAYKLAAARLLLLGWVQRIQGGDGLGCWDQPRPADGRSPLRLIESSAVELDGHVWSHVSISRRDRVMPTWEQVREAFRLIHPDRYGVVVIPPADKHVNIAEVAHVWCDMTADTVPDFTRGTGSI